MCLTSCERKYIIKNNSVYLKGWNEGNGSYERLVKDADAKTFKNLKFKNTNGVYGKDKENVFFDGIVVENCDPKTFEFIGNYLFKDRDALFFFGFFSSPKDWRIEISNLNKVRIFEYPWFTDDLNLYHGSKLVKIKNIVDFQVLNRNWSKTRTKIIYENSIVENVDYETFEVIDNYTAKDKNHTFYDGKISN